MTDADARRAFYIVGVFAREKYAGNHVAVIRHGRQYSDREMQAIARDIGPAAFLLDDEPGPAGFPVRIFTPTVELPFSGHPTVGAAYVIQRELLREPASRIDVSLPGGSVPLALTHRDGAVLEVSMRQQDARFGRVIDAGDAARALRLDPGDLDARFPVEEASTGLGYVMVPVRTEQVLRRARIDDDRASTLTRDGEAKAFAVFCPEAADPEHRLHIRAFTGYYGVPEDPGTGTANGALAAYVVRHRYLGEARVDTWSEQGVSVGRPSRLHLRAEERNGAIQVHVGGPMVMVARGTLL
jgi:trans-2,3-dihydro-3-hydroxyanthranilate isomerase